MIKRLALSAVLCLITTSALAAPPAKTPPHMATPAEAIAEAEAHCFEPHRANCIADDLLRKVQLEVVRASAHISLAALAVNYLHKPRSEVVARAGEMIARIKQQTPLVDVITALDLPAPALQGVRTYWAQVSECFAKAYPGPSEEMDAFDTRSKACDVRLQQDVDGVLVDLGYEAQEKHFGFRKSAWGDTPESVVAAEGQPVSKEDNERTFVYQTTLSGHEAKAYFNFVEGKLAIGTYVLSADHADANEFVNDYDEIAEALKIKYGKPNLHDVIWADGALKKDRAYWGDELAAGHMFIGQSWHLADVSITHLLGGENGKIHHRLSYTSVEMQPLIDKAKAAKAQEGL
jgi:hypothetical protein